MKIILVPDDWREWVLVPKTNNAVPHQDTGWMCVNDEQCSHRGPYSTCADCVEMFAAAHASIIAAAPPCRVVELPERNGVDFGWNACLDEIERRAKTLA